MLSKHLKYYKNKDWLRWQILTDFRR